MSKLSFCFTIIFLLACLFIIWDRSFYTALYSLELAIPTCSKSLDASVNVLGYRETLGQIPFLVVLRFCSWLYWLLLCFYVKNIMTWPTYNGKVYRVYSCRGIRIHHGWEATDMTARAASQRLASQTSRWMQGEQTGNGTWLCNFKVLPQLHTSSSKAAPMKPTRTEPPTDDKILKHLILWGHSHSNHNTPNSRKIQWS